MFQSYVVLKLTDKPKVNPFSFPPKLQLDEKITVVCSAASGSGSLSFMWFQNGQPLSTHDNIKIDVTNDYSVLTIDPLTSKNIANFSCLITNDYGSDSYSASLIVECELFLKILNTFD